MPKHRIIRNQKITPEKRELAKELRRNMTPAEKLLWAKLRTNRLNGYHFRRQQIIDGFVVDFYCHSVGLVIEIDGPIHQQQKDYDLERTRILKEHGLHLIRFQNQEVMNELDTTLQKILMVCDQLSKEARDIPTN
ncbi:MAG: DUF559 domain-containing protein [Anaerolineaceae bacterium]|nr:DUF559 domain-containing protein [Anaerolineaceae bacterium]